MNTIRKKELGFVSNAAKRVAMLLAPRYKKCDQETCTYGGPMFKIEFRSEINTCVTESFRDPTINSVNSLSRLPRAGRVGKARTPPAANETKLGRLPQSTRLISRLQHAVKNPLSEQKEVLTACTTKPSGNRSWQRTSRRMFSQRTEDCCLLRYLARKSTITVATNTKEVIVPTQSPHPGRFTGSEPLT